MFEQFDWTKNHNGSQQRNRISRCFGLCLSIAGLIAISLMIWPAALPVPVATAQQQPVDQVIPNRYIVVFKEEAFTNGVTAAGMTTAQLAEQMVSDLKGQLHYTYGDALKGFAATLSPEAVQKLAANPDVASIKPDQVGYFDDIQSPTPSWGLDRIDQRIGPLDGRFRADVSGKGVHIYVIDTGIFVSHNDFRGRMGNGAGFEPGFEDPNSDCQGHGTHVAGIAAGTTYGVAKQATIHSVRVSRDCNPIARFSYSTLIAAINWVKSNHVKPAVVNMSLGGPPSPEVDQVVNSLIAAGVTVVAAAGNIDPIFSPDPISCNHSPARIPDAITVGSSSLWGVDRRSPFSKYGACVDIFAPGHSITSAGIDSDWDSFVNSGSSMAAPHVAGWAAMYLSVFTRATPAEVSSELIRHSTKDVLWEKGDDATPNRLLYVTNITDNACLVQTSVASAAEASGAANETADTFGMLYRLRNEVFPNSEFGRELIRIHRTHSFEAARLLLTDPNLRTQLLEMLESSRPAVDSLLNGDGQRPLDRDLIQKIEAYINGVAQHAGSEMRVDLLRALQDAHLQNYAERPVGDAWKEIGRPQPQDRSRNEVRQQ